MSAIVDCPGCQFGEHEKHDPRWGVIDGLLGGCVCNCQGDCAAAWQARIERFNETFRIAVPADETKRP